MILIVTGEKDNHLPYVLPFLREYTILNTGDIPENVNCSLTNQNVRLVIRGRAIEGDDIKAIWMRKPNPIASRSADVNISRFIEREWNFFLKNFYQVSANLRWMNHPEKNMACCQKIEQLRRARSFGISVPDTLMTNSEDDAKSFVSIHECCILKVVDQVITVVEGVERRMYAKKITAEDIKKVKGLHVSPVILQSYIEKDFELRITYVDGRLFVCRIDSQATQGSKFDWRAGNIDDVPHSEYELPLDVKEKIIKLVESYDLKFSAIDFIVTPDGEYVFLEINPNGQWAWIEFLTKMPIGKAIAEFLNGK